MATGSTIVAAKQGLLALLNDRPGLDGVSVTFADPVVQGRQDCVYFGDTRISNQELYALGTRKRDEEYELQLFIDVRGKATYEKSEVRALDLVHEIEGAVASQPSLDVDGVLACWVSELTLRTDDMGDFPITRAEMAITVKGRVEAS